MCEDGYPIDFILKQEHLNSDCDGQYVTSHLIPLHLCLYKYNILAIVATQQPLKMRLYIDKGETN